ncbi:MAG: SCO family protein [Chitinophagaceae bacterium]|nr:SCO family protein [Chitinophagaceae bacterium]
MNKKAAFALTIAIILPVLCYYAVKWTSEEAIVMPRRYFMDSVITKTIDGKTTTDTIWHKTENITLVNQLGDTVSLYDIQNKVIVADFFFTRCPSICPTLTRNMEKMQQSFSHYNEGRRVIDSSIVHFVSFSIDPERDTVPALKKYADRFGIDHDNWWMLTGPKKKIYDFALNEVKLGMVDGEGVDTSFIHSQKIVLIDKDHIVRGYYNGLDTLELSVLARDIALLMLEKDKSKKRNLFRK